MDNTTNATETIVDKDKDMAQESTEQMVETEKAEPEAAPEEIPKELNGVCGRLIEIGQGDIVSPCLFLLCGGVSHVICYEYDHSHQVVYARPTENGIFR